MASFLRLCQASEGKAQGVDAASGRLRPPCPLREYPTRTGREASTRRLTSLPDGRPSHREDRRRLWCSSQEKILCLWCVQSRVTASSCLPTVNPMIRAQSQAVGAPCSSYIGEARRMWSAVCSRSSTAGRRPGAKIPPGGGGASSKARIPVRSTSGQPGRKAKRGRLDADLFWGRDHDEESIRAAGFKRSKTEGAYFAGVRRLESVNCCRISTVTRYTE
jgi:hypothetical protein